ncbi:extracellular catalytic domain type 1 short-chain-length polyhydroxyalkanoate depolymerase [Gordonia rhizosphera]|uniref:Polyhydroxybutyrate depolymerase n=1 Tax=Gordonia rhizosphera NBRC 16068 TaxID=1108045 RepID=K6WQ48_9ACTN|nr:PHB depolymerase family esterase [Gordonia rhizosphera]GAB88664.1 hypothetical protein GORHZ_035_00040 [Gordonia rhizosphera NBRC 16068]
MTPGRIRIRVLLAGIGVVALCLAAAPGGVLAAPSVGGHSTGTIGAGALARTFEMYRPAGLTRPAPLVVVLHGGYGSGKQAERSYHWDAQADRGRFVAVFPNGVGRSWNAGTCCGPAQQSNADDVAFIRAVVDKVAAQTPIDRSRAYVTGMSNGAMMAYRLACQTDLFAAAAPVAGTILTDCSRAHPISVLHIHGTNDQSVPYGGGPGRYYSLKGTARVDGPSVPAVNATFRRIDSCAPPSVRRAGVVTTSVARCPGSRTVELITVDGAGHQWPGSSRSPLMDLVRPGNAPSTAFDATAVIWDFFAAHHR